MSFISSLSAYVPAVDSWGAIINILIWGVLLGGSIGVIIKVIRDKLKYKYQGEIFKRRQSNDEGAPEAVNLGGKAGYFKDKKTGRTIFRIKFGLMPWQQVQLNKLPDPKYMIGNKVYYVQLNKDNLVQAKLEVDWNGKFKLNPVEDDLKAMAMMDIKDKENALSVTKMTPLVVGMVVMGLIIMSGIIVFYFLGKA